MNKKEMYMNEAYISGVNDILILILLADELGSWEGALLEFDWDRIKDSTIVKENLDKVRELWGILSK